MAPHLFLTGYMGSGKSTVGRKVARLLDWEFADLDAIVEAEAGRDIPSIFLSEGEAGFRSRECAAIQKVLDRAPPNDGLVVALGGGTLTYPPSARLIDGQGTVVYLDVDAATAWARVCGSDRPLAGDWGDFERRMTARRAHYEGAASLVLFAGKEGVDALAQRVADFVRRDEEGRS